MIKSYSGWPGKVVTGEGALASMAITALEDDVGDTNPVATTVQECEEVFYKCFSK